MLLLKTLNSNFFRVKSHLKQSKYLFLWGKMADLHGISTDDSLFLNFGKEAEYALLLKPCKILFISLACQMNSSSLKFAYSPFYHNLLKIGL